MKRAIATIAAIAFAVTALHAQDLGEITEIYNNGAAALTNGEKASALESFQKALGLAEALGEEGQEVVANCKNVIPNLSLSIAKDLVKASKFDEAMSSLAAVAELAKSYSDEGVAEEAAGLIPQVLKQKATSLLSAKKYDEAAEAYKQIIAADPTDGSSAFRLGQALNAAGKAEEAIAAFQQAAENGQEANAIKQIQNIHLKNASSALKAKSYADAVAAALKVTELGDNAQAWQIAAQASQLAGKNADAIKYFEKYLELSPDAANAGQIAYTIGALYQNEKNNAKAKEFYQKASTDAKYGAEAKKLLEALK